MPHHRRSLVAVLMAVLLAVAGSMADILPTSTASARPAVVSAATLHATVTNGRLKVSGTRQVPAGELNLSLRSVGATGEVQMVQLLNHYSFSDLRADIKAFTRSFGPNGPSRAGVRHLDHAIAHTTLFGGLGCEAGRHVSGTVVLPKPGTYYLYNDSRNLPSQPVRLTATSPSAAQGLPSADATVTLKNSMRFGGAHTLPAAGTIRVRNAASESPHQLILQHVKDGTTRRQIVRYIRHGGQGRTPFARRGHADADTLDQHVVQTLHYHLPPGEYAELCYFPDPRNGVSHAAMGMVGIVHLK